jgi:hypothetical protein
VQENLSPALKHKKMPSSSPVDSNLKKVRIALDSDDEDENILSYELPAIGEISSVEIGNVSNVNSLSAAADHLSAPLNVLTSAAKEVEEPICIDAVDVDMNPVNPVLTENVPEVVNLNSQSRKNIVEDQATEPFIMTPSPELIKDVLGGFSERCSKNGTWLMGLPDFCTDGETSSRVSKLCLDDLKYRSSLYQLGNEIGPSLITPELEKEFLEHNDLISAWTALDVSALEVYTYIAFVYFLICSISFHN